MSKKILSRLKKKCDGCTSCGLHKKRTQAVFASGNRAADIVFVGEGPGKDEDEQGKPFVGRAGGELDKMIRYMGLDRKDVYITNVVKCRPPKNRTPFEDEADTCSKRFLNKEIAAIKPKVIIAMGKTASNCVLHTRDSVARLRGRWREVEGIDVMCTYHPAYLLRRPDEKKKVQADLKIVMKKLGLTRPKKAK